MPILQQATTLRHGSKYKSTPLRNTLRSAFGEESLFGGQNKESTFSFVNTAVISTTETWQEAVVHANYNRPEPSMPHYRFERPDDPRQEMHAWEAAAATSAAPAFFKPFTSDRTGSTYLDGAIFHNNPVRVANSERKVLWPDVEKCHPDLFLSIGTGKPRAITHGRIPDNEPEGSSLTKRRDRLAVPQPKERRRKNGVNMMQTLRGLHSRMDSIINAEFIWSNFRRDAYNSTDPDSIKSRYIRLNPSLREEPPPLDAKDQIKRLQNEVRSRLSSSTYKTRIAKVANRLVASQFFFEKDKILRMSPELDQLQTCHGMLQSPIPGSILTFLGSIYCRFENGTPLLRGLGEHLRTHQREDFQPFFSVGGSEGEPELCKVRIECASLQDADLRFPYTLFCTLKIVLFTDSLTYLQIELSANTLDRMVNQAHFAIEKIRFGVRGPQTAITISLALQGHRSPNDEEYRLYPISGFPRYLITEDRVQRK